MTEKQKKLAIIVGVIVIALLLLMSRKPGTTIVNQKGLDPTQVSLPSNDMPIRSPFIINIPGLPSYTPYQYSAVSPCMCNGAATTLGAYQGPLVTFVTNQGNSGPNIYNYTPPPPPKNVFYGYGSSG
jgi:hypothetical protein